MAEEWNCVPDVLRPCPPGGSYTVAPGDTLCAVARRFGIPLAALVEANPWLAGVNFLPPGLVLRLPALPSPAMGCPNGNYYTVGPGDSLFAIAARFGLSLEALLAANPQVAESNEIHAGQTICIPAVPPVVLPPLPGFTRFGCPFGIAACPMRRCPLGRGTRRGRKMGPRDRTGRR